MDSTTGISVVFERKPGARIGRRYFRRFNKSEGTPIIRKIVRGDNLSKNQVKKLSESVLNGFSSTIPYSLNKQKRWKTLGTVDAVLNSVKAENCTISAAKRSRKATKDFKVDVYGRIKPGFDSEIEKIKCQGKGCVVESLSDSLNCAKDGKTKKKDKNVEKFVEPEVTVIIDPNCEDWRLFARGEAILGKASSIGGSKTRRSNKMERMTDIMDGIVEDEHVDEESDSEDDHSGRISKFNLADFVVETSEVKQRERIQTARTLDDYEVVEDLEAMIKAIDEATEARNKTHEPVRIPRSGTMKEVIVTEQSLNFTADTFAKVLESFVAENPIVQLYWTNGSKTECLVDFSGVIQWGKFDVVIGFSVFKNQRSKRDFPFLRMMINSTLSLKYSPGSYLAFRTSASGIPGLKKEHLFFHFLVDNIRKQLDLFYQKSQLRQIKLEEPFEVYSKVMTRNYPIVTSLFELDLLKIAQESVPTNCEIVVDPSVAKDQCGLCDAKLDSNRFNMNCGHHLCQSCSGFIFEEQIKNFEQDLTCPTCQTIQDPLKMAFILPLALIHIFLKNRFEQKTKYGIVECRKCCGIFEKIPDARGIRCQRCEYVFCQKCHGVPHFPLTCEQFNIWKKKFTEQWNWLTLKSITPKHECGYCKIFKNDETIDENGLLTCNYCEKKLLPGKSYSMSFYHGRLHVTSFSDIFKTEFPSPKIPQLIPVKYLEFYLNILEEIKNETIQLQIKKSVDEKFLSKKETQKFMEKLVEILDFLSFSTIWIYLEKNNEKTKKMEKVEKNLEKIFESYKTVVNLVLKNSSMVKTRKLKGIPWGKRHYYPKINLVKMPKPRPITEMDKLIFKENYTTLKTNFLIIRQLFD